MCPARSELTFGALARMSDIAADPFVRRQYPALSEALWKAASQQLRNMATLGGNLMQRTRCAYFRDTSYPCNKRVPGSGCSALEGINRGHAILGVSDACIAAYPGDWAVALAAFDAIIDTLSPRGARSIPLLDFHREPGSTPHIETAIAADELIVRIRVPVTKLGKGSTYQKVRDRQSYAFALTSAAVAVEIVDGRVRDARIALGGVATRPWRARDAEQSLIGQPLTEERARRAGELAFRGAQTRPLNAFKVPLGVNTVVQALDDCAPEGVTMIENFIGADAQRVDGADKVMGKARYGADRLLPRMAYALPVTSTIGKGRIRNIDTSKAEAIPGVILVLTHLNMDRLKPFRFIFAGGHGSQSLQPLQSDAIAYRGQPVALIIANNLEAAQAARSVIDIDYETTPFSVELDGEGGEPVIQSVAAPYFPDFVAGDADRALGEAPIVIDAKYTTPAQHHNAMELLSTVAEWQGDQLIVHEGTQAAQALAQGLAIQLDVDPAKVRVIAPYVGGAFGQRNSIAPHTVLAAVAARRVGRPVKLVMPRDQIFHAVHFRPAAEHRLRLGADDSGKFIAAVHEVRVQTSRFDLMPFTGAETISRMYGFPEFPQLDHAGQARHANARLHACPVRDELMRRTRGRNR